VAPHLLSLEATEIFTFSGNNALHLNIETHKTTADGWTPVVLYLKDLEISLWMDADGRVAELRDPEFQSNNSIFQIDATNGYFILGEKRFPLIAKSQTAIRTRLKLCDADLPLAIRVDKKNNKASLLIGKNPLSFIRIRAEFIEAQPGSKELKIRGPGIHAMKRFIYTESTGCIYSTRLHRGPVDLSQSRIWAIKAN
jgi:hypothetical protein